MSESLPPPIPAVGVVCLRGDEVLLIRRGAPPRLGEWSLPGGRIEPGEGVRAAALRELHEETGVEARLTGLIDVVDGIFPDAGRHYVLIDFVAEWISGEPVAGDDAAEAAFVPVQQALELLTWSETRGVIEKAVRFGRVGELANSA
ncbi:NUDIX hydrolase [Brevundimonas sp.]|uniref:NUDIX hydrolase n=1 Tax=Brevundimonas sp. TaxID=1871086 RepID=UPI00391D7011